MATHKRLTHDQKLEIYKMAREMLRETQRVFLRDMAHEYTTADRLIVKDVMNTTPKKWKNAFVLRALAQFRKKYPQA